MVTKRKTLFLLFIAGISLLAVNVLPHHHHSDFPCFRIWEENHSCGQERSHSENPCKNQCMADFAKTVVSASQHSTGIGQLQPVVICLFKENMPDFNNSPGPVFSFHLIPYIEHLHGIHISRSLGLRAPPAAIA